VHGLQKWHFCEQNHDLVRKSPRSFLPVTILKPKPAHVTILFTEVQFLQAIEVRFD
jgi:hypothetical protein